MITLNKIISKYNYNNFLWHAIFLALATSFMDIDTIMPSMLNDAGGKVSHLGILITIMLGGATFSQLFFVFYLYNKKFKKNMLLVGIHLRILALLGLAGLFYIFDEIGINLRIWLILIIVSVFSFSGAFANISYVDILGKSVLNKQRKSFFSLKQVISAIGIVVSAMLARKVLTTYDVPFNYTILFMFAAFFLFVATAGFWRLKEIPSISHKGTKSFNLISFIKTEWKNNKKLKYYLLVTSTLGISISMLPFLIMYAKETFITQTYNLGNLLLLKVSGAIIVGLLLFYTSKKFKYTFTLYSTMILAVSIPIFAYISKNNYFLFMTSFFIGGIMFTIYKISINGVLLEISNNNNRTIYAGLAGIGNIIPALFPLLGGWLIKTRGFNDFFILYMLIILTSSIFIKRLKCKK